MILNYNRNKYPIHTFKMDEFFHTYSKYIEYYVI